MQPPAINKRVLLMAAASAAIVVVAVGGWSVADATIRPKSPQPSKQVSSQASTQPTTPVAAHPSGSAAAPGGTAGTPAGSPVTSPLPINTFSDQPPRAGFHEFPANCVMTHRLNDDPIVFPGLPGASHNHTFVGNPITTASTVPKDLLGGRTSCQDPKDASSYWFPTLLQNGQPVSPQTVTVYYKSGVKDYRTVQPFPAGFRLVVGSAKATSNAEFTGTWTCGGDEFTEIPPSCPDGSSLIVRLKAPSCWDNVHLDTTDHKSHMAYPVNGVCPSTHPVALPMLQLKVPYKLPGGNTSGLAFASGPGYTFHYDFMNGWDQARQAQVIAHCVNGGRQCNGDGIDKHRP